MVTKQPSYSLLQLVNYFLKLGTTGFGGPVALVGYMHRDLVEQRKWITEEEYKEGLALAQLAPGPLAAQLGIYLGFVHHGVLGATLAGIAFVLPSFIIVVLLGMAYKLYGGLPGMQAIFYGVGAAVIGIIVLSTYKLTLKTVSKLNLPAIKKNWLLWLFYSIAAVITIITESESIFLFLGCGILYMLIKAPPASMNKKMNGILLGGIGFWQVETDVLGKIAVFFAKPELLFLGVALP